MINSKGHSSPNGVPALDNVTTDSGPFSVEDAQRHMQALSSKATSATDSIIPQPETGKLGDVEFYRYYRTILANAEVKLGDEIQEPLTCLEIANESEFLTYGTLGNFSLLVGKAKSRKTYLLSAMVAALIKGETVMGKIRGRLPPDKRMILYFDTEQHKGHVKRILKRIAALSGDGVLRSIRIFQLKKYPPDQRLSAIRVAVEDTLDLGVIVIDGIRDTVFDINDAREATERATDLLQWTEEKDAHLLTVIHENKGNSNARGHLGSELVNKAETVVSVGRDPSDKSVSIVTAEYCRDKEFEPFGFSIGEDGLPHLVDGVSIVPVEKQRTKKPTADSMQADDISSILIRAFQSQESLRYNQVLISVLEASEFVGIPLAKSRAETFIKRVTNSGYLIRSKDAGQRYETYKLNSDKTSNQPP